MPEGSHVTCHSVPANGTHKDVNQKKLNSSLFLSLPPTNSLPMLVKVRWSESSSNDGWGPWERDDGGLRRDSVPDSRFAQTHQDIRFVPWGHYTPTTAYGDAVAKLPFAKLGDYVERKQAESKGSLLLAGVCYVLTEE